MTHTERCENLANELGIGIAVAADIVYLDDLRARMIACAKAIKNVGGFPTENKTLEVFLAVRGF